MKDDFGVMRGGSVLFMDGWRVNVRAEDSLARGRLQEDAMEFFLLVLKQVCKVLSLSIAIGSKTVGKDVGRQENARKFARVMENWRQVWARDQVRAKEALVLPVALDERTVPQDWVCVLVRSITAGEKLGDAKQLLLRVYDHAKRVSASRKLARNLDVLVRGVGSQVAGMEPQVEFMDVPECRVSAQRSLCAFGSVLGCVASVAQESFMDISSEAFVPDLGRALRAAFAKFRKELGERGFRDVDRLLEDAASCRSALRSLFTVPALLARRDDHDVVRGD